MTQSRIQIARLYDDAKPVAGARILVDRLWPRGISKDRLHCDAWLKEIAPSTELREWFHHEVANWPEFRRRYEAELDANPAAVEELLGWCRKGPVTLLYGAKDTEHNQAAVLRDYVTARLAG